MEQATGNYFFYNGEVVPVNRFDEFFKPEGVSIFEVFRVIAGVPVFLEEHLGRLQFSAFKAGLDFSSGFDSIFENINRFIGMNNLVSGNVKLVGCLKNKLPEVWIFSIPFKYPSESDYRNGVPLGILNAERANPMAKTIQRSLREKANEKITSRKVYEVLLADSEGFITEGSRSNVFFVTRNKQLVTPPENRVLNGITRQKVISLARGLQIDFIETSVKVAGLSGFDAVFITGTSPKLLAANSVGELPFNPQNEVYSTLKKAYDNLLENYIGQKTGGKGC